MYIYMCDVYSTAIYDCQQKRFHLTNGDEIRDNRYLSLVVDAPWESLSSTDYAAVVIEVRLLDTFWSKYILSL